MTDKELISRSTYEDKKKKIVFLSTEQYGFGKVLRKYAFYPSFLPICSYFEHSSPPFYDEIWNIEKKFMSHIFFHRRRFSDQWNQLYKAKASLAGL